MDTLFGLTEVYADDREVTVDGVVEPEELSDIPDTATVLISGGYICANEPVDMSLERAFTRWKVTQTHDTLVVQIPRDYTAALHKYLKTIKGRVIS